MSIKEAAADWVVRINDPDVTETEFNEWQGWLAEDAAHREAYQALEHAWHRAAQVDVALSPSRHEHRSSPWPLAAGVLLCIVAGGLFWYVQHSHVIETATAEQRSVRLKDGSRVELAGESRLIVDMSKDMRALRLEEGEAYFDVAQDAARPFVVRVGGHEVRALGTTFNVEKGADRVVVTVTQGAVRVSGSGMPVVLRAGEQAAIVSHEVRKIAVVSKPEAATAWRDGRLEYLHEELRYVIDDVNRYVERKVVLKDADLGRMEFTGTVFLDHLDEWLTTLSGSFPVIVVEKGKERALLRDSKEIR